MIIDALIVVAAYMTGFLTGIYYFKKKVEQKKKKAMKDVNEAIGGMINDDEG